MKFLLIISLFSIGFQSVGQNVNLDMFLHPMVKAYASEVKNCEVDDLNIGSLSSLKGVCRGLVDSGFCSEIEDEYLVNCNKLMFDTSGFLPSEYEMRNQSFPSFVKECGIGVGQSGWSNITAVAMIIGAIIAAADYVWNEEDWSTEVVNNIASAWHYITTEADRLEEEEGFIWPFISSLFIEPVANEYKELGCLNEEGQTKVMCQLLTDALTIVAPAVAAKVFIGTKTAVAGTAITGGMVATGMASTGAAVAGTTGGIVTGGVGGVITGGAVSAGVVVGALTIGTLKFIAKRVMKSVKKKKTSSSDSGDTQIANTNVGKEAQDLTHRSNQQRLADKTPDISLSSDPTLHPAMKPKPTPEPPVTSNLNNTVDNNPRALRTVEIMSGKKKPSHSSRNVSPNASPSSSSTSSKASPSPNPPSTPRVNLKSTIDSSNIAKMQEQAQRGAIEAMKKRQIPSPPPPPPINRMLERAGKEARLETLKNPTGK